MGPSHLSWGFMAKTAEIIRSNTLSSFMYVMSFICDFGAFCEAMLLSLTRLTLINLDNASWFSFSVANLGCVTGWRRKLDML